MHPRNIYKNPIDFKALAEDYPEFSRVCQLDTFGKVKLNFKDHESVRILSKCCLHKDFNLNVDLPKEKLLPTVPLRLNYLLWIEDLLKYIGGSSDISGIDIGCGASCIYCLLSVRMNKSWKMFALEIDNENVKYARENVSRNNLDENIEVIQQDDCNKIFDKLFQIQHHPKTFCMCNPPFYSSHDEINSSNRTGKRKFPRSETTGTSSELVFSTGGEFGFINKIINESVQLKGKIQIYSTMIGCKKNFERILLELKAKNISSFTKTIFVQGKTTRWGIAWSFTHDLTSFKDHLEKSKILQSAKKVLTYNITNLEFKETVEYLSKIFNDLSIKVKSIEEKDQLIRWELVAAENTWSNQRQRRRAKCKNTEVASNSTNNYETESKLHIGLEIQNSNDSILLKMFFIEGSMDRDCVNQILQYIKNRFISFVK